MVAFVLISFIPISHLSGQTLYPVKVYRTMDDFEKGSYIDTVAYRRNESLPIKFNYKDTIVDNVIFKASDHRKFQNSFAVECQGELYFQVKYMVKKKNRVKRSRKFYFNHDYLSYLRVSKNGPKPEIRTLIYNSWGTTSFGTSKICRIIYKKEEKKFEIIW